jgi:hypothetical protein
VTGGEIFGWVVIAVGTVAAIAAFDFIQRNLPDALGDDYSDADSRTAALLGALNDVGVKVGQPNQRAGRRLDGPTDLQNTEQSHTQIPDIARRETGV